MTRFILVRAQIHADRIDLDVASGRLVRWLLDEGGKEAIDARLPVEEGRAQMPMTRDRGDRPRWTFDQAEHSGEPEANRKRDEVRRRRRLEFHSSRCDANPASLAGQQNPQAQCSRSGEPLPFEDIAAEERISSTYATRLVRLTFLAPDIVAAILAGKQPAGLTANKLMADTRLPLDWSEQANSLLGFT